MKMKFNQGYALFMQDKAAECSEKSLEYYAGTLKMFVVFLTDYKQKLIDDIYLDDITVLDLKQYIIYLKAKPKYQGNPLISMENHQNEKISKTTIKTYQRSVKIFFTYCYRENLMNYDITSNYRLVKTDYKEKIPLYNAEVEEIDALYNQKTETGCRNLCIVHLMLDVGARVGEVIALRICDIMFDKNLLLLHGKGSKERLVPLGKRLKKLLMSYLIKYRRISVDAMGNPKGFCDDYVFISLRTREHLSETAVTMMFRKIKERSGITRVHPHLLRHTFATAYMLQGGDLESLRLILGHTSLSTTSIYLHLAQKYLMLNQDVYKLDIIFKKLF